MENHSFRCKLKNGWHFLRSFVLSLSPGGAMTADKLDKVSGLATTARMAVDLHGEFSMISPQYFDIAAQV